MTVYGHENALSVTVKQMIQHCKPLKKGPKTFFCILAIPYGSYSTKNVAIKNAAKMMKASGAELINLQCGKGRVDIVRALAAAGIPIMSHFGFLPHLLHLYGGLKCRAKTEKMRFKLSKKQLL